MIKNLIGIMTLAGILLISCDPVKKNYKLPVYGNSNIIERTENGKTVYDTIPHKVGYFRLLNQDSTIVTPATLDGKVFVADFFFTSCITLCPRMEQQMLRVYNEFQTNDSVAIVSYSIDPTYDNVEVLKSHESKLEVSSDTWHFLTGDKGEIYDLANKSYMTERPADDPDAENNILHSGAFILVDTQKRIRGVYDGTVPAQVELLMKDIKKLLKEGNENT